MLNRLQQAQVKPDVDGVWASAFCQAKSCCPFGPPRPGAATPQTCGQRGALLDSETKGESYQLVE
ncbi:hypothetical protein E2C01_088474 [Portunus trituberculatus]|uniref:Uncharacterized protein n=1 Tax=Portunus trituberculatus TaxID=210409 RepID=A0A5B7JEK6_PORTR|nr:hypothetical protein [Portunus trituberculatus]